MKINQTAKGLTTILLCVHIVKHAGPTLSSPYSAEGEPFQTDSGISLQDSGVETFATTGPGIETFVTGSGVLKRCADSDSIDSQDHIDADWGSDKKKKELIPLLEMSTNQPFCKKNKKFLIGCFAIAVVTAVFIAGSSAMIGKGIQIHFNHLAVIDKNTLNITLFAVEGDTIVLGMVDTGVFSMVMVEETTERGDSSHSSSVFIASHNSLKRHSANINKQFSGFYSKVPWRTTGLIDHTYILDGGLINYSFCATHPSESTGDGFIYVFNNEKNYSDYSAQTPGSKSFSSVDKKKLRIGTFNQWECRSIEFPIDYPGYYFVVVDTPGDLYYNYSYEIRDIHLDRMDYDSVCDEVYEGKACSFDLPTEAGLHYVLAYVSPHFDLESHTTHLHLLTSGVTKTVNYQLNLSVGLFSAGGVVLLLCFVFIVVCVIVHVCVRRKKNRPLLLYNDVLC